MAVPQLWKGAAPRMLDKGAIPQVLEKRPFLKHWGGVCVPQVLDKWRFLKYWERGYSSIIGKGVVPQEWEEWALLKRGKLDAGRTCRMGEPDDAVWESMDVERQPAASARRCQHPSTPQLWRGDTHPMRALPGTRATGTFPGTTLGPGQGAPAWRAERMKRR